MNWYKLAKNYSIQNHKKTIFSITQEEYDESFNDYYYEEYLENEDEEVIKEREKEKEKNIKIWSEKLPQIEKKSEKLKYCDFYTTIIVGIEEAFISPEIVILFKFNGHVFDDNYEILSKLQYRPWEEVHKKEEKLLISMSGLYETTNKFMGNFNNYFGTSNIEINKIDNGIDVLCFFETSKEIKDIDFLDNLVNSLFDFERNSYYELWLSIKSELEKMKILS